VREQCVGVHSVAAVSSAARAVVGPMAVVVGASIGHVSAGVSNAMPLPRDVVRFGSVWLRPVYSLSRQSSPDLDGTYTFGDLGT